PTPASGWSQDSTSDSYWAAALASGTSNSVTQKYPLLTVFIRALLSLPLGNADCERGFSENKHITDSRANLGIAAVNGILQVKSFVKHFDSDPSRVPLTRELLKAVQRSHKTYLKRLQREAEDRERRKRKASAVCEPVTEKKIKLGEGKLCVEMCLESSKAMMERAHGLIKMGLRDKNIDEVESGQNKWQQHQLLWCRTCARQVQPWVVQLQYLQPWMEQLVPWDLHPLMQLLKHPLRRIDITS
ncbi:hypothetical protein HPB47_003613, partial [Ixodes persulcatus]